MSNYPNTHGALLAAALVATFGVCGAQEPAPPASPPPQDAATPVIQPEAIATLHKMGEYLRSLKTFSISVDNTTDEVLMSGQKIQVGGTTTLIARKPNGLKAMVRQR